MFESFKKKRVYEGVKLIENLSKCKHIYGKWTNPEYSAEGIIVQQHRCVLCDWVERKQTIWYNPKKFKNSFQKLMIEILTDLKVEFETPKIKENRDD